MGTGDAIDEMVALSEQLSLTDMVQFLVECPTSPSSAAFRPRTYAYHPTPDPLNASRR